jgi:phage terminase large subunit
VEEWRPHPGPQEEALTRNEFEILYGGARGGGKTDAGLVWLTELVGNPRYRALVIRRNADDLSDWIDRARRMYSVIGAQIAYRPPIIKFPSGATIKTGHLKDENAYGKYQGHEYHRILIEELTQIPSEKMYLQLIASCRSTIKELVPQIFLTTNPGGVGHGWVKRRFVDVAEPGNVFIDPDTGRSRIFIPAKIDDNPHLISNDPGYIKMLDGLKKTDEQLWKAWRLGSWEVFIGQVFTEFRYDIHVTDRFGIDLNNCIKIISFDWGYRDPGCATWIALSPENKYGVHHAFVYRELYQNQKTPEKWAEEISIFTKLEDTKFMVLPHDCFSEAKGSRTIASTFAQKLKTRIIMGNTLAKNARINRAAITHQFLSESSDGFPYVQVHPKCLNLIRTLPELVYDDTNVEDVDTDGEDHAYDALSLGLMTLTEKFKLDSGPVKARSARIVTRPIITTKQGDYMGQDFWEKIKEDLVSKKGGNVEFK